MASIGIDLDEVAINFIDPFCEWHNLNYGTNLTREGVYSFKLHKVMNCSQEEGIERVLKFQRSHYFENLKPFPDSVIGIKALSQDNNLHIVTSRLTEFGKQTQRHINLLPNVFSGVYTTGAYPGEYSPSIMKSSICKKLGITTILEDNLDEALDCAKNEIRALLFNRPWNQTNHLNEYITRVYSWQDALEKI